jgi:MerR family transcriptional regulator, thiopeptide resistance regulator
MEEWSIAEVGRMARVTARALRHYDSVGLLRPSRVGADGRRFYGRPELLRLQRILLLRELDLGLPAIAAALDGGDEAAVLRAHRDRLAAERDRLTRLLRTVDRTIEEGAAMAAEELFDGFEAEARERWGDEAVDAAHARLGGLAGDEAALFRTGFRRVRDGLAPLRAAGVPVTDPRVQDLVALHLRVVGLSWTPDAAAYRGLARLYAEDERFHAELGGPGLVDYLGAAMEVHAATRMPR